MMNVDFRQSIFICASLVKLTGEKIMRPQEHQSYPKALALAAALAVPLLLSGCGDGKQTVGTAAPPPRPVLVERVHYAPLQSARTFDATIKPRTEADLSFRIGGKVLKRSVDVGASVRAGQTLALLDETDLNAQLEQAEAEVTAAQGNLATAEAELERRMSLNKQGFATLANLQQQKAVVDEASGRLIKGQRARTLAQNALGYSRLLADADGVVTVALVEPGQVVTSGQSVLRVARTGDREALVAIPEALIERARHGQATVSLWSNPGKVYRAVLRELSPTADAATRTYAARFSLPEAGPEVVLGMTATVTISDTGVAEAARLPLAALFDEGRGPALWVVDRITGALSLKPVDVAKYDGTSVYIQNGVSEGDDVVTLGVQKLDAGQKVRVVAAMGS